MEHWETCRDIAGNVFTVKTVSDYSICWEPDYVIEANIRSFKNYIDYLKKLCLEDKHNFELYKSFVDIRNSDFNCLKNRFDYIYKNSDLDDEDFFFIANFYNNPDYLPECLKEDYLEIYGGN